MLNVKIIDYLLGCCIIIGNAKTSYFKRFRCLFFKRLKREVGEIPTRSRHCKWEQSANTTVHMYGKVQDCNDHEPGDLPTLDTPKPTRIGRCLENLFFDYSNISISSVEMFFCIYCLLNVIQETGRSLIERSG